MLAVTPGVTGVVFPWCSVGFAPIVVLTPGTALAAVDGQADSGDVLRFIGRKKNRGIGDVPRIAHPSHWARRIPRAQHLLRCAELAGNLLVDKRRVHDARQDRVRSYAVRSIMNG